LADVFGAEGNPDGMAPLGSRERVDGWIETVGTQLMGLGPEMLMDVKYGVLIDFTGT
jgi:hypothetical protein